MAGAVFQKCQKETGKVSARDAVAGHAVCVTVHRKHERDEEGPDLA